MKYSYCDGCLVGYSNSLDVRRLMPLTWSNTVNEFALEGIILPELNVTNKSDYRMLLKDTIVEVTYKDIDKSYLFKRGFIWDLASVPRPFRSLIDNDDLELQFAAMVHDYNFETHDLSFKDSNKLFKAMIRSAGGNKTKANLAYFGVSSVVGRILYSKNAKIRGYMKNFVEETDLDI